MCRYGEHPYKDHFACFACRRAFKRTAVDPWPTHLAPAEGESSPPPCPLCGEPMADMGLDFEAPPARDLEHWAVVAFLHRRGFAYHSCGCGGPGDRPSRWADVPAFLDAHARRSEGERLAARFEARARAGYPARSPR